MKAYFSRKEPFYFLTVKEASDEKGFDAYPVEVDPVVLANVSSIKRLLAATEALFLRSPAPEENAQGEADAVSAEIRKIFKTKAQDNAAE